MSDKKPKSARGWLAPFSTPSDAGQFATTHWSVILAAGDSASEKHGPALSMLCQTYWFPLYAYLRRRGYDSHQAEDYTQGFFATILERKGLQKADPKYGKFRSFLLVSLKNFLADEWDRSHAQKRGGDKKVLSLDFDAAADRYDRELPRGTPYGAAQSLTPEKLFERSWALTLLSRAMDRLKAESSASPVRDGQAQDKQRLFDYLKIYLTAEKDDVPYQDVAVKLNMTEGAVKVAVHRLRRRYRELVRDEIAQTVTTEAQIDEEIRDLFAALT